MFSSQIRQYLAILVSLIVLSNLRSTAIKLNCDGGYDIIIGVETNVVEPLNDGSFINEIRAGVDAFSAELWKATNQRFYINSVDVLIPANWWTFHEAETATWQTLLNSEIRLTHDVAAPTVVNPNPCGSAGLYIDLPDSFFKIPRGGKYGPVGKALVNLWARYRFGVHEEHGLPGSERFPYFHSRPSLEPHWEATGCSNEELQGDFKTIDGDISDRCDPYGVDIPSDDCRLIPSSTNSANSSLLHFHWLDSVTQFCDSKSHDLLAPNRQNLFCGHRSIWEVIRETDDYKSTKSITESVSRPKFRVLKDSRVPQLYILLDKGRTVTPEPVLKDIRKSLIKLVNAPSIEKINIAVGTYPHANQGKDHYYVKEEVGWAPIDQVINDLESVFESATDPSGPVIRDFGLAIQEVAEKVKLRNHLAGTVILIVKRGAGPNVFDKITHEQEVLASIKEDNRIAVFAIETQQGDQTPYTNLQSLVEATSGRYHLINDTMNTERKLEGILGIIQTILEQPSIMNSLSSWVTQKQYTTPEEEIEIPIYDFVNHVKIHLTTNKHMLASDISLDLVSGEYASLQQTEKFEWDESADLSRRLVFTYIIRNPSPGSVWRLKHGCNTEKLSDCRFFLLVTAQLDNPTPRQSNGILDTHFFNGQSINIDISTSAEHYYLDMSRQGMKIVPFAIFAKIEMHQQRVLGLENVTALVRLGGDHDSHIGIWTVELKDDGRGLPDVSAHDGIYSGVFIPPEDGLYQISVHASGVSNANALTGGGSSFQDVRIVNQAGSLIAKDQYNFGCRNSSKPRCVSAVPLGSFSRVMDMMSTVAVENAATFKPGKPMKILDFSATTGPNFAVQFRFTSPKLLGSDASPEEFRIYMAPHPDNFLGSTDMTKLLIQEIGRPSGEYVTINYNAAQQAIPYYAVEAIYEGQKGGPSNVIGVVPYEHEPIIPSTTTLNPITSTSTTDAPSTTETPLTTTTDRPTTSLTTPVWPTEPSTTTEAYSTTTEESEETDPEVTSRTTVRPETSTSTPIPSSSTTTELPSSSSTTTESPSSSSTTTELSSSSSTTTELPSSSSTTAVPPITSDITDPIGSSSTTTTPPPDSTPDEDVTSTSTSTTPEPSLPPSSSTSTESPSSTTTTQNPSSSTSTTELPPITSDITDISSSTTTPQPSSSSTENPSSSTTEEPSPSTSTTTEQNPSSSTTTIEPSTTTTEQPDPSSSTTVDPSSSTTLQPDPSSSTTTESPTTTSTELPPITSDITDISSSTTTPQPSSSSTENPSSSTTEEPNPSSSTTTEQNPTSSSTTEEPSTTQKPDPTSSTTIEPSSTTTDIPLTSTSTSENPSSTTTEPSTSSSTTEVSTTSTSENPSSTSTSTSTEPPIISSTTELSSTSTSTSGNPSSSSTSTENPISSSSTTTEASSTSSSTSENPSSSSTSTENPTSSSTTSTEPSSTSFTSTTTETISTSTSSENSSSSESPVSSSSTHSTSEQASSSTSESETPESSAAPANILFSPVVLASVALSSIFLNPRLLS